MNRGRRGIGWLPAAVAVMIWSVAGESMASGKEEIVERAEGVFEKAKKLAVEDPDGARELFRAAGDGFALAAGVVGDEGAAHYNAGNAYLLSGDAGEAVFHYRMAQIHRPFDPNIAHNLENARRQILDSVTVRPARSALDLVAAGARWVPSWVRGGLFVLGYIGLFGVLVGMLIWGRPEWGRRLVMVCGGVVAAAGLSLVVEWWVCHGGRDGVVVAEEVVARTGDGDVYPWAFTSPLHAGVEFRVLETRGDWMRVRLWSGDEGWVAVSGVRVVANR